jgi:4-amino-4-deoxy-L-arabinose transferase-like glycosyltransferase
MRLEMVALITLGFIALATGISEAPLTDWDEATYAEVVHEATATGSYLNFTWNGASYLKKPPALFWMMAASSKLFGESEWAARLPSVVMGLGTLLIIYCSATAAVGRMAGTFGGLIPLGFYFFIARGGRECATDAPLVFFSTLAICGLTLARTNRRWLGVVGPACGFAILSKGLAGLVPLMAVALAVLVLPGFSAIAIGALMVQATIAMLVAAPWFVYQAIINGNLFWSTFVKQETLLRVASHLEDEPHAAYFTIWILVGEVRHLWPLILPLAGLAAVAVRTGIRRTLQRVPAALMIWLIWFALALGAACAVRTKLGWYILPALIPVALIGGSILAAAFMQKRTARFYCMPLGVLALVILIAKAPAQWREIGQSFQKQRDRSRPSFMMGLRARDLAIVHGGGDLFFAGTTLPTLVYYSGMHCDFVSPAQPEFELTDLGGNPISVLYHELVFRGLDGGVTAVGNFDDEWNRSGPYWERGPQLDLRTELEVP